MAKPAAPTEVGGSKLHFQSDSTATTPVAKNNAAVESAASGEASFPVGWNGVATHRQGDTLTAPGGFSATDGNGPVIIIAGLDGTTVRAVSVDSSGHLQVDDAATIACTQSGTWNVGSISTMAALVAGTAEIGAVVQAGWDTAGHAVSRGIATDDTSTTATSLLANDASNLYNIHHIGWTIYTGSTEPAGLMTLDFLLDTAGTAFHSEYIPVTSNSVISGSRDFRVPVQTTVDNNNVTVHMSAAGGTGWTYSALVLAYKAAS